MIMMGWLVNAGVATAQERVVPEEVLPVRWGAEGETVPLEIYLSAHRRRGFLSIEWAEGDRWTSAVYPMWKARAVDLNGDGEQELVMGIWSRMQRHQGPVVQRAIWVMRFDGQALVPMWQGSAMAYRLIDFEVEVQEKEQGGVLRALERDEGRCFRAGYRWNGFGFYGVDREIVDCGDGLKRSER